MGVELIAFQQVRARCVGREDENKGRKAIYLDRFFPLLHARNRFVRLFLRLKHVKEAHVGTKKPKHTATNIQDTVAISHTIMVKNGRIKEMN